MKILHLPAVLCGRFGPGLRPARCKTAGTWRRGAILGMVGGAWLALAMPDAIAADVPRGGGPAVDALSVVKIRSKMISDARSRSTLGPEREGTGIVIDSSGLILTIGYLIQEAETVEVAAADSRPVPASVIGYDFTTGFGLLRAVREPQIRPIA